MSEQASKIPLIWILIAFVCAVLVLYPLQGILLPFVVAAGLTYILSPVINLMQRILRLPRLVVVLLFYLIVFLCFGFAIYEAGPYLLKMMQDINRKTEEFISRSAYEILDRRRISVMGLTLDAETVSRQLIEKLQGGLKSSEGIAHTAGIAVKSLFKAVLTIVILFYFLYDGKNLLKRLLHLFPEQKQEYIRYLGVRVHAVLGRFLRGVAIIVIFAAAVMWPVLKFYFDLPYAVPLALLIGMLEVIPVAGPIASGIITTFAAYSHGGPWIALKIIAFYAIFRLLIDQVVGPAVLGRAVILPPVVIIFFFLAGGTLFGVTGLLLAIPIAATIRILIETEKRGFVAEEAKSENSLQEQ